MGAACVCCQRPIVATATYVVDTAAPVNVGLPAEGATVDVYEGGSFLRDEQEALPAPPSAPGPPPTAAACAPDPEEPPPPPARSQPVRISTDALRRFVEQERESLICPPAADSDVSYATVDGEVTQYYYSDVE
jgi:hypothetical protein